VDQSEPANVSQFYFSAQVLQVHIDLPVYK